MKNLKVSPPKIIEQVDWECEVKLLYREENIGCRAAISSGIDWFFRHVDEGIILEDDCLPSKSFFRFCQDLLEKYRHNDRVMQINGSFYLDNLISSKESYYYWMRSLYNKITLQMIVGLFYYNTSKEVRLII